MFVTRHSGRLLSEHFRLLLRVSTNELRSRYAGAVFGMGWVFLTPLLMLSIYAVVYLLIFRVRVPGLSASQYVLYIFSGLVPYLMTSEAVASSVTSVISSRSVWTNTVFPVDLAPVKAVLLSQLSMVIGMVAIVAGLVGTGSLRWTIVLVPVVWVLHVVALIGLTWILSLVNLVFRDLQNLIGLALMVLMVASPIAYTPAMVPAHLKLLLLANPYYPFLVSYQELIVLGKIPSLTVVLSMIVISASLFLTGGYFFSRAKPVMLDYV